MLHRSFTLAALLAALPGIHGTAAAAELKVFATGSMADPLQELAATFTRETGHTLEFEVSTTGGVLAKLRAGETADIIVVSEEAAAGLGRSDTFLAGTTRPFASAVFGVVVKAGAPVPNVATEEAFRDTMLRARSLAYPDPVAATVSGGYIEEVFARLGVRDAARSKAALKPMGYLVGEAVANGEAELGLSFASEFVANPALRVVPFPASLQRAQLYVAGVATATRAAEAARAFVTFVTSARVREELEAAGVEPAAR